GSRAPLTLHSFPTRRSSDLYPDVIESVAIGGNPAALIKSHHNVGGLPEKMNFELVEPLRQLFKDEVRQAGLQLGLPNEIVHRQRSEEHTSELQSLTNLACRL